jgi:vitamin K-dependent gamma-carboxylase-like protein
MVPAELRAALRAGWRPLFAFRALFGLLVLLRFGTFLAEGYAGARSGDFFHMAMWSWLDGSSADVLFRVALWELPILAVLIIHGRFRWSATLAGIAMAYLGAVDVVSYQNSHATYALLGIGLGWTPEAWRGAVSAASGASGASAAAPEAPSVGLLFTRAGVSVMYLFAGLWKLNAAFLRGSAVVAFFRSNWPYRVSWVAHAFDRLEATGLLRVLGVGVAAAELFLALALWSRRTRRVACAIGILVHGTFAVVGFRDRNLLCWSALIVSSYLVFAGRGATPAARWLPRPRGRFAAAAALLATLVVHDALAVLQLTTSPGGALFATFNMWDRGYIGFATEAHLQTEDGRPVTPIPLQKWSWRPFIYTPALQNAEIRERFAAYVAARPQVQQWVTRVGAPCVLVLSYTQLIIYEPPRAWVSVLSITPADHTADAARE